MTVTLRSEVAVQRRRSQDYWGHKRRQEVWRWKSPSGVQGLSRGRGSPRSLSFFVKLHIIFALKYNKQQLLLLLDKINLAAKYTFKNIFHFQLFKN